MKDISKAWLDAAKDDLGVLQCIEQRGDLTKMTAFHAQQAVEKSLKAVLEENNQAIPRTHNLQRLLALAGTFLTLNVDEACIDDLDKLYLDSRYPGDIGLLPDGNPDQKSARRYRQQAEQIYQEITAFLGGIRHEHM
jgi:HEPN domain-containing protein